MKILILNGPNLNLVGKREPSIYGDSSFDGFYDSLVKQYGSECELFYYQSNHEGSLIDKLHEVGFSYDGIVLNAGAYTHTSIAILDAIKAITTPVIEVHMSNIHQREEFRHKSVIAQACKGSVVGFGLQSYKMALVYLLENKD